MEVDWAAMKEVQLAYVVERLAETKPYGPLRMFVAAVQLAAGDAYPELEPIVRDALPADKVEMLTAHGHLTPSSGHLPPAGADARPHGAT